MVENLPVNAGDGGSIPGSGGRNGNPLQYSCLGNPMDRGVWWATVQRVAKSWHDSVTEHAWIVFQLSTVTSGHHLITVAFLLVFLLDQSESSN